MTNEQVETMLRKAASEWRAKGHDLDVIEAQLKVLVMRALAPMRDLEHSLGRFKT